MYLPSACPPHVRIGGRTEGNACGTRLSEYGAPCTALDVRIRSKEMSVQRHYSNYEKEKKKGIPFRISSTLSTLLALQGTLMRLCSPCRLGGISDPPRYTKRRSSKSASFPLHSNP